MILTRLLIGTTALTGIALLADGDHLSQVITARPELGAVLLSVAMFIGLFIHMIRVTRQESHSWREEAAAERRYHADKDSKDREERKEARAECHSISVKMTEAAVRCADAAEKCVEYVEKKT